MKFILASIIGLFSLASQAQQMSFTGTWILKDQKSVSGQLYSNGVPKQMTITQTGSSITIEKITASSAEDITTRETPGTDAAPFETTTPAGRKKLITIHWDGNAGFTETANLYAAADKTKLELVYTDIVTMEDGKMLWDRKVQNLFTGENWESKSIYEKQ